VTGGQPTFDQLKKASEAGFKTVINLRTNAEQPSPAQESSWAEDGCDYSEGLTITGSIAMTKGLTHVSPSSIRLMI